MPDPQERPHAARTEAELSALDEWLGRHLARLNREHADIHAELRARRDEATTTVAEPFAGGMLNYVNDRTPMAEFGPLGDPYADEARVRAMRSTAKLAAVVALLAAAAVGVAALLA